jgi:WD40 repeat protein
LQYGYVLESSDAWLVAGSITDDWFESNGCRDWDANPEVDVHRIDPNSGQRVPIYSGWDSSEFGLEVAMSDDGQRAVLGVFVPPEGTLKVIDIETGDLIQTITPPPLIAGVGLSPDGSIAVSSGDIGTVRLYDVASGEFLVEVPAPETGANATGTWFSEDGSLIYVPHFDGVVRIYDTTTGALVSKLPPIDDVATLTQLTADNQRAVVFGGGLARVSALGAADTAEVAHLNPCGPAAADVFFMNRGLAVHDDLVTIYAFCDFTGGSYDEQPMAFTYEFATGELIATHRTSGQRFAVIGDSIAAMELWTERADGTVVAGEVSIVDLRSGEIIDTLPNICNWNWDAYFDENSLDCVDGSGVGFNNEDIVMSQDRNIVAIGTEESPGAAWAWNRSNGVFIELGDPIAVMALSPDETRLAASEPVDLGKRAEGALRLYSTDTFELLAEVSTAGEPFGRSGIDFTRDGASIVGITNSGLVRFHDAVTLEETDLFAPHEVGARDIDLNLDGQMMATVGLDGFARVWDVDTLTLLHEIEVGGLPTAVAFAEDDSQLAVTTRHGGVNVFHLDLDNILDVARERLRRDFTEDECRLYFPDGGCPTFEEVSSG